MAASRHSVLTEGGERDREAQDAISRPRAPGILLGIGLGGFIDGIVLHQILQWHHMLTSEGSYPQTTVAGLETNTLWDGLFHVATWVAVAVGIYILWRRANRLALGDQRTAAGAGRPSRRPPVYLG